MWGSQVRQKVSLLLMTVNPLPNLLSRPMPRPLISMPLTLRTDLTQCSSGLHGTPPDTHSHNYPPVGCGRRCPCCWCSPYPSGTGSLPHPLTPTHLITHLWVMAESVLVVDAASCCPTLPLSMEQGLVPRLLKGKETCVHLTADTGICEPSCPIMELHPVRVCACVCVLSCHYNGKVQGSYVHIQKWK